MRDTISGYSTALFSTWWFIYELGLLFDAGDGIVAHLLQRSRKIKHVFISHADRDHLTGLLQLNQLNSREDGFPKIYYPAHSGSFPALEQFSKKFDSHTGLAEWIPILPGDEIEVQKNIFVRVIGNTHLPIKNGKIKSYSFHLVEKRKKLKAEYRKLSSSELVNIKDRYGPDHITEPAEKILISYSGDTPVEKDGRWDESEILIHEATFLDAPDGEAIRERLNKHSVLGDVIDMVSRTKVKTLILGHFSSRYKASDIDAAIAIACKTYGLHIPVYRLLPGEFTDDITNCPHIPPAR